MIYAYSVLTGYVTMRGSVFIHLPMFIAMLVCLSPFYGNQIPLPEEMEWQAASGGFWIYYGTFIHLVLGALHFLSFTEIPPKAVTYRLICQILGVLAQVFNFTIVGYLYAGAPAYELLNNSQRAFIGWIEIEVLMIAAIVFSNSLFLFIRSLHLGQIELTFGFMDHKQDYLGCEETEILLSLFSTLLSFAWTNVALTGSFPGIGSPSALFEATSEESKQMLLQQTYLQVAQFLLLLNLMIFPSDWSCCMKNLKL